MTTSHSPPRPRSRGRLWPVAWALALAFQAGAASLPEAEREVARAAQALVAARASLASLEGEARTLAEEVGRLQAAQSGPRAGRDLERRLRAFDALALRLDEADARVAQAERARRRARARFDAQADAEEARLSSSAAPGAGLVAWAEARARVAALSGGDETVRPPLDVRAEEHDGPGELRAKLALVDAERARLADEARRLAAEERLLAARLEARRALAAELGAARRQAGGEVALLERAADEASRALAALEGRRAAAQAAGDGAARALRGLDERRQDLAGRLARLGPGEREKR